jgi:ABC-2 type transport system permease protein
MMKNNMNGLSGLLSVYLKELRGYFNSLIAYVVILVFLTSLGLYTWVFPDTVFDGGVADLYNMFNSTWIVFLFLIPAITMGSFAEEKKTGTIELLFTRPLTEWQIIIGKNMAAFSLVLFALLPTAFYVYTVYQLGDPIGNLDMAATVGSYIGILLLALAFTSIGVFTSSITSNQIVAFIFALFLSLLMFDGISYTATIFNWSDYSYGISSLGLNVHYNNLSKGLIDFKNVIYMVSFSIFFLVATRLVLVSRNW